MTEVCVFEAKMALFAAAGRAAAARDVHDDETAALWRSRADYARDWLCIACDAQDGARNEQVAA